MSAIAGLAGRVPHLAPRLGLTNAVLAVLVAALGTGAFFALRDTPSSSTRATARTAAAARGVVLSSVSASGTIAAAHDLAVQFETAGRVVSIAVEPGQRVAKGDVLGRLDPTDAQAALRQAQAGLVTARASLLETESGETAAEREAAAIAIAQATAQVAQAQTQLRQAQAQLAADERSTRQAIRSAQSTLSLKQAQTQLRTDQGNLKAAVAQLASDKAKLTVSGTTYPSAEAAVAAWTQVVDQDRAQLQAATQANYDLQAQQTADQQKLSADQAQLSRATSASDKETWQATVDADQNAVNYNASRLQQQSKLLNQIQYQLSQDQEQLQTLQTLQSTITQDQSAIKSLEAKIVADRNAIANATASRTSQIQTAITNRTSTLTKDRQAIASARQQVQSAKLSLRATQAANAQKATVSPAALAQSRAGVVQAEANVATAKQALAETVLRAPVAGTVAKVGGVVGQTVSGGGVSQVSSSSASSGATGAGSGSGSSSFVELVGLSGMEVTASFSESDAAKIRVGQAGTVTVSALPDRKLAAHVVGIDVAGTTSSSVVEYTVTLALDRTVAGLKPGMSTSVSLTTAERANVINVPSAAINGSGQTATVTVVDDDGTQHSVPVVVGLKGDSSTEIVSGLTAGQRVVISSGTPLATSDSGTRTTGGFQRGGFGGLGGGGVRGAGLAGGPRG